MRHFDDIDWTRILNGTGTSLRSVEEAGATAEGKGERRSQAAPREEVSWVVQCIQGLY